MKLVVSGRGKTVIINDPNMGDLVQREHPQN